MQIIEAVTRSGVGISPGAPILDAAKLMEQRGVGALVVVDDNGGPVGFVTDRDLVRRGTAGHLDPSARVDAVMSSPAVTVDAGVDAAEACAAFVANSIRHLVVTQDGTFVGVVTMKDVMPGVPVPTGPARPRSASVTSASARRQTPAKAG
ncbi:MAG TPA: CBS domain-containing protein [Acidimicrobiales bacterium]|nr:CBS domain-containing protein [Acidimicrobiales bacterium]